MLPPRAIMRVVVAIKDRLLLGLRHRPLVEVGALVALESLAVRSALETHAELVEMKTLV